jgi:taurine dioxygenase
MLNTGPLWEGMGVEFLGVDLSRKIAPGTMREILAALHRHQVILFRGQRLAPERFERFGGGFGEPIPHVLDHLRMPGHPDIFVLSNAPERPEEIRNGAAYWHTDQSYDKAPASATMLYAIQVPRVGGETHFADMFGAYDALPEAMRRRIDGLTVVHLYGNRDAGKDGEPIAAPLLNEAQVAAVPEVTHPLVRPHPVTGRKALYAVAGTSRGIFGMPDEEAVALLLELKRHALQPRFVRKHKYAVGDLIVWDTSSTLHAGSPMGPATEPSNTRLLHRISVRGLPPVLARSA